MLIEGSNIQNNSGVTEQGVKINRTPIKKNCQKVQTGLLVLTVAAAIVATVPPLRLAGSLALRGISVLSSSVNALDTFKTDSRFGKCVSIGKIGITILGVTALAVASPVLIIASLAADIGTQAIETVKVALSKEKQGSKTWEIVCRISVIFVDSLVLAAVVACSWQLIVAAACISGVALLALGIAAMCRKSEDNVDATCKWIDGLCYIALSIISFTNAGMCAERSTRDKTSCEVTLENQNSDKTLEVYDKNGKLLATINPGEKVNITIDYPNEFHNNDELRLVLKDQNGVPVDTWKTNGHHHNYGPSYVNHPAIPHKDMHKVPVGSKIINHSIVKDREFEPVKTSNSMNSPGRSYSSGSSSGPGFGAGLATGLVLGFAGGHVKNHHVRIW